MVTETLETIPSTGELLDRVATLRTDAALMDGYAQRLLATAGALTDRAVAPVWGRPTLEQQAAACTTAAEQLRTAAEALLAHMRAGG
ncbi:hypothetical protein ACGFYV_03020 [Streptomyces sp. NPDC048297]|uniref:hypothetical protein n=1 Tax=Streptomyces sp. NPDC048297 TaxID=3365531 RepID=UPI003723B284